MLKNSPSPYLSKKFKNWEVIYRQGVRADEAFRLITRVCFREPDQHQYQRVASSDYANVFFTRMSVGDQSVGVYIKDYCFRSRADFLKHFFRASRARRAFNASFMLRENGFNAPEPLILMQKKAGPFTTKAILITREAVDAQKLRHTFWKVVENGLTPKRNFLKKFGRVIGRMHARGIIHGDLRIGNVLVQESGGDHSFWFIDNERTVRFASPPVNLIKKNLVQLNMFGYKSLSNTDKMRFIKEYAQQRGLSREEMRNIVRLVLDKTSWRVRKKEDKRQRNRGMCSALIYR